jgi:hypothetical protein
MGVLMVADHKAEQTEAARFQTGGGMFDTARLEIKVQTLFDPVTLTDKTPSGCRVSACHGRSVKVFISFWRAVCVLCLVTCSHQCDNRDPLIPSSHGASLITDHELSNFVDDSAGTLDWTPAFATCLPCFAQERTPTLAPNPLHVRCLIDYSRVSRVIHTTWGHVRSVYSERAVTVPKHRLSRLSC